MHQGGDALQARLRVDVVYRHVGDAHAEAAEHGNDEGRFLVPGNHQRIACSQARRACTFDPVLGAAVQARPVHHAIGGVQGRGLRGDLQVGEAAVVEIEVHRAVSGAVEEVEPS